MAALATTTHQKLQVQIPQRPRRMLKNRERRDAESRFRANAGSIADASKQSTECAVQPGPGSGDIKKSSPIAQVDEVLWQNLIEPFFAGIWHEPSKFLYATSLCFRSFSQYPPYFTQRNKGASVT